MAKEKLPHATDWKNRSIEDWTATTFRSYFGALHEDVLGIPYAPFRNWGVESKMIKVAYEEYGKEVVKRFIEAEVTAYNSTAAYPGTSFGFLFSYRKNVIQRIKIDYDKEVERRSRTTTTNTDDWTW